METHLILNPAAGRGTVRRVEPELLKAVGEQLGDVQLHRTESHGHATQIAQALKQTNSLIMIHPCTVDRRCTERRSALQSDVSAVLYGDSPRFAAKVVMDPPPAARVPFQERRALGSPIEPEADRLPRKSRVLPGQPDRKALRASSRAGNGADRRVDGPARAPGRCRLRRSACRSRRRSHWTGLPPHRDRRAGPRRRSRQRSRRRGLRHRRR